MSGKRSASETGSNDMSKNEKRQTLKPWLDPDENDDDFTEESKARYRELVQGAQGYKNRISTRITGSRGGKIRKTKTQSPMTVTKDANKRGSTSKNLEESKQNPTDDVVSIGEELNPGILTIRGQRADLYEEGIVHGFEVFRSYAKAAFPGPNWDEIDLLKLRNQGNDG